MGDIRRAWRAALAVGTFAGLAALGACGLSGDEAASTDDLEELAPRLQHPEDPGPGCGDAAVTDPGNLDRSRVVARCAPGAPVPRPLDERATVRVAISSQHEDLAPLALADELGELERENVALELVPVRNLDDAYRALGEGEVDAVAGDLHAAFFDMVVEGDGARLALGGPVSTAAGDPSVPQAGLWMASGALSGPNQWHELESETLAVAEGISGASVYPLTFTFAQGDASPNDFRLVQADGTRAAELLLEGDVPVAWLEDPFWQPVADAGGFELVTTRPVEALGGVVLHERLLDPAADREVGLAFTRAVVRTVNTHLTEGYRDDEEVASAIRDFTGWDREQMDRVPPRVFDWELREGTVERIQAAMVPLGAVLFEEEFVDGEAERRFVDRSLYLDVVG